MNMDDEEEIQVTTIEAARLELHQAAIDSLGKKPADTLMEHLPPTGWADVARKQDLVAQDKVTGIQFEALNRRLDRHFDFQLVIIGIVAAGFFGLTAAIITKL